MLSSQASTQKEVNEWFLSVYADAYEWVELPNVSGMALFADGGIMASKPYASSGAYINRMSNYCKDCHYDVKEKIGKKACPFNYLYWNFLDRNREKLSSNPRLGLAYRKLNNMSEDQLSAVKESAQIFFSVLIMKKTDLPPKVCPVCKRSFNWRKKWKSVWEK
ncbi:MAG: hypothetical protein Ct9H90mP13_06720 [Pseudomonadota bacterium]|nr:MAG: hypothetical protein Ct9H90mP13_06720 [Pseudomonadota bacterium]